MPSQPPRRQLGTAPRAVRITDDFLMSDAAMAVLRLLGREAQDRLVLDLAAVPVPTPGGMAALLRLNEDLRGRLCLVNVPLPVYHVFRLTRLTEVLDVRPLGAR